MYFFFIETHTFQQCENSCTLFKSKTFFRRYRKTPNTGEMNTKRKSERPAKQRKAREILGEGCGGLASVWRVGRTAEDRWMYGRSVKAATSGNG